MNRPIPMSGLQKTLAVLVFAACCGGRAAADTPFPPPSDSIPRIGPKKAAKMGKAPTPVVSPSGDSVDWKGILGETPPDEFSPRAAKAIANHFGLSLPLVPAEFPAGKPVEIDAFSCSLIQKRNYTTQNCKFVARLSLDRSKFKNGREANKALLDQIAAVKDSPPVQKLSLFLNNLDMVLAMLGRCGGYRLGVEKDRLLFDPGQSPGGTAIAVPATMIFLSVNPDQLMPGAKWTLTRFKDASSETCSICQDGKFILYDEKSAAPDHLNCKPEEKP